MTNTFTAVFEHRGDWWIGYVEEVPGANTQGKTLDEARENLKEAVQLVLEVNREQARQHAIGTEVVREELTISA
jgi:predicted RNase H-like HicB family nuclease